MSLFPAPADAVSLYTGSVMHARMVKPQHRFTYRVFSLLIDLDRLEEADRASRFFSVGRFNLLSFHEKDHGAGTPTGLAAHVRQALAQAGVREPAARVLALAYPRVLGYVFNPLTVHFAYGAAGNLLGVVYEVSNTFGDRHAYVAPVAEGELTAAGLRQERDKIFYVSPFLDMDMRYRFRILPPGDRVRLRILEVNRDGPTLAATFAGTRRPLTSRSSLAAFLSHPLMTAKVLGGIHWEALRLWLKGAKLFPHTKPALPASWNMPGRFSVATSGGAVTERAEAAAPAYSAGDQGPR